MFDIELAKKDKAPNLIHDIIFKDKCILDRKYYVPLNYSPCYLFPIRDCPEYGLFLGLSQM